MNLKFNQNLLDNFTCFSSLTPEEKMLVQANAHYSQQSKNKKIFCKGEVCTRLYFITKGSIKTHTTDAKSRKEHINSIEHSGDIFGECCLFGSKTKSFDSTTLEEDTRYFSIDINLFRKLMNSNFEFNLAVLEMIGNKMQKARERLIDFATKDARSRIVEFLKLNAEVVGLKVGYETLVRHGLTQQDIAIYTGTSRQTVTTVLNDLKKSNQIFLRRKSILIRDVSSLN